MRLIETYSFTGCRAAGGPWETRIASVDAADVVASARRWCAEIRQRVAEQTPPRSPEKWRFTTDPDNIHIPCGDFDIAIRTSGDRWYITTYYGEGEDYSLSCEK